MVGASASAFENRLDQVITFLNQDRHICYLGITVKFVGGWTDVNTDVRWTCNMFPGDFPEIIKLNNPVINKHFWNDYGKLQLWPRCRSSFRLTTKTPAVRVISVDFRKLCSAIAHNRQKFAIKETTGRNNGEVYDK